jgi:hypothetical protein
MDGWKNMREERNKMKTCKEGSKKRQEGIEKKHRGRVTETGLTVSVYSKSKRHGKETLVWNVCKKKLNYMKLVR